MLWLFKCSIVALRAGLLVKRDIVQIDKNYIKIKMLIPS